MENLTHRTVLFADLRGSTGLFERLGNADAATVVAGSVDRLGQVAVKCGGRVVKTLGDGLMVVFEAPRGAVDAADGMHAALDRIAREGPVIQGDRPALQLQIAMAHGEVVDVGSDCFGEVVNLASRLLDRAADQETLATESVLNGLDAGQRERFRSLSSLQLRGRQEPVAVYRLEAMRFDDTTATPLWPASPAARIERIRLTRLDASCVFSGPELPAVLGRSPQAVHRIEDSRVSRSHARIDWHGGTFQVSDLSYNGSFVRFAGSDEVVTLKRGSCTLHGSGSICLGSPPTDPTAPVVRFEVLSEIDAPT
jgi:class 3 adenylate cyclase